MTNIHHSAGSIRGGSIMSFRLLEGSGGARSIAPGVGVDYIMGFGYLVDQGGTIKASSILGAYIMALRPLLPNQALNQACRIEVAITKTASMLDSINGLSLYLFSTFELHLLHLH